MPGQVHEHVQLGRANTEWGTEDTKGTLRSMSAGDAYDRLDELD